MNTIRTASLLLTAALAACGGSGSDDASFSLAVTDAPVDNADEVVLTFNSVELLGGDEPVVAQLDPPVQVDLLQLQGDNSTFLVSDLSIPPAVYTHIRFGIDAAAQSCQNISGDEASYITIDGTSYPIGVPSGELRINAPLTIAAGGQASFTVDFDLRKSLAERGSTGCYNIRPTALRVIDNAEVGTLTGSVDGALLSDDSCTADTASGEGAAVYVFSGTGVTPDDFDPEPLTTALLKPEQVADGAEPTGDFTYTVGFLLTGTYTVALTCNAAADVPDQDDEVGFLQTGEASITADATTPLDFTSMDPAPAR